MSKTESSIADAGINRILGVIKNSSLDGAVIANASEAIERNRAGLGKMFESFLYKAPTSSDEWCDELTRATMGIITPILRDAQVPIEAGRKVYQAVYNAVSG